MGEKNNLLKRLKNIAKQQGEVLLVDEKTGELFALSYIEDVDSCCGADCDCGSVKTFEENNHTNKVELGSDIDEIELMKKVNEDIAKWRAEEKNNVDNKTVLEESSEDIKDEISDNLMEEERYYLEPLE
ncbi:MAG: hypothetical protein COV52_02160 [Gammaproteobacteria bacterium CG11_big_fil_rev_8_21_14_0_20_46_22]|nr:MAG: hypothetical protein COV52_02160 [Gammaproteobacteria bacterium CG11_big_fil_rev_8_21_14_0_20_46_22]